MVMSLKKHISAVNRQITQIKYKDFFLEEEGEITVSAAITTLLFTFMINLSVIFLPAGSELTVVASLGCFGLSGNPENSHHKKEELKGTKTVIWAFR